MLVIIAPNTFSVPSPFPSLGIAITYVLGYLMLSHSLMILCALFAPVSFFYARFGWFLLPCPQVHSSSLSKCLISCSIPFSEFFHLTCCIFKSRSSIWIFKIYFICLFFMLIISSDFLDRNLAFSSYLTISAF